MSYINITADIRGLDGVQRNLQRISNDIHRGQAVAAALNKTAAKANAEINRAVPERFAIRAGEVRNAISLRRASRGKFEAVLSIFGSAKRRGRSLNVVHFLAAVQAAGRAV